MCRRFFTMSPTDIIKCGIRFADEHEYKIFEYRVDYFRNRVKLMFSNSPKYKAFRCFVNAWDISPTEIIHHEFDNRCKYKEGDVNTSSGKFIL